MPNDTRYAISPTLRRAIRRGRLTQRQLARLIELEAAALGLSPEEAIKRARAGTLPRHYVADDLAQLVRLQDVAVLA